MQKKKVLLWTLVNLAFLVHMSCGEENTVTNDYSEDPRLMIVRDESGKENFNGNIAGASYEIPSTEYGSVTQEFDIHFEYLWDWGFISVGLGCKDSESAGKVSDIRIMFIRKSHWSRGQTIGEFSFNDTDQIRVVTTTELEEIPLKANRTYHVKMKYQKGEYVQVIVSGKDEEGFLDEWDSGKLRADGKANFDNVFFVVRSFIGSDIHYDEKREHIYLKGVSGSGSSAPSPYTSSAFVDNMVITYGEPK